MTNSPPITNAILPNFGQAHRIKMGTRMLTRTRVMSQLPQGIDQNKGLSRLSMGQGTLSRRHNEKTVPGAAAALAHHVSGRRSCVESGPDRVGSPHFNTAISRWQLPSSERDFGRLRNTAGL